MGGRFEQDALDFIARGSGEYDERTITRPGRRKAPKTSDSPKEAERPLDVIFQHVV